MPSLPRTEKTRIVTSARAHVGHVSVARGSSQVATSSFFDGCCCQAQCDDGDPTLWHSSSAAPLLHRGFSGTHSLCLPYVGKVDPH